MRLALVIKKVIGSYPGIESIFRLTLGLGLRQSRDRKVFTDASVYSAIGLLGSHEGLSDLMMWLQITRGRFE